MPISRAGTTRDRRWRRRAEELEKWLAMELCRSYRAACRVWANSSWKRRLLQASGWFLCHYNNKNNFFKKRVRYNFLFKKKRKKVLWEVICECLIKMCNQHNSTAPVYCYFGQITWGRASGGINCYSPLKSVGLWKSYTTHDLPYICNNFGPFHCAANTLKQQWLVLHAFELVSCRLSYFGVFISSTYSSSFPCKPFQRRLLESTRRGVWTTQGFGDTMLCWRASSLCFPLRRLGSLG